MLIARFLLFFSVHNHHPIIFPELWLLFTDHHCWKCPHAIAHCISFHQPLLVPPMVTVFTKPWLLCCSILSDGTMADQPLSTSSLHHKHSLLPQSPPSQELDRWCPNKKEMSEASNRSTYLYRLLGCLTKKDKPESNFSKTWDDWNGTTNMGCDGWVDNS